MATALMVNGDSAAVLPALADRSVDAVVTDPPWNLGRDYGRHSDDLPQAQYIEWLNGVIRQCARVSKGPVVAFLGDHNRPYIPALLDQTGLEVLEQLIWWREPRAGELVIVAARSSNRFPQAAVAIARERLARFGDPAQRWGHPCPKPVPALAGLVQLVTSPGGLVLDPFAGTGSTLVAAGILGRSALGIELEYRFCLTATHRLISRPRFHFSPAASGLAL